MIRHMERHKCGFKPIIVQHPMEFVFHIGAACKAQPEEATGLGFRGLVAVLCGDEGEHKFNGSNGKADSVDFAVRGQRRVVRSTFSVESNGLVDIFEPMFVFQCALHQIYCGTAQGS